MHSQLIKPGLTQKNKVALRDFELREVCEELCIQSSTECLFDCDSTDVDCIQQCLRNQTKCINGKRFLFFCYFHSLYFELVHVVWNALTGVKDAQILFATVPRLLFRR